MCPILCQVCLLVIAIEAVPKLASNQASRWVVRNSSTGGNWGKMAAPPHRRHFVWTLMLGMFAGICGSFFLQYFVLTNNYFYNYVALSEWHAHCQIAVINGSTTQVLAQHADNSRIDIKDILPKYNRTSEELHAGENELSDALFERIRILCFVMTQPANHKSKAEHVLNTWGKRCNILYFVSSEQFENHTTAIYNGTESRDILWGKTKVGFKYAYEEHFEDADWFVKADDDTYMIMENLRYMLLDKNPAAPVYYGCKYKVIVPQGYMSGGAGYVLSKEALRRFIEESLPNKNKCKQSDSGAEDAEMGFCLANVGVEAGDSRDQESRLRFFPFVPHDHVTPGKTDPEYWYWKNIWYTHEQGIDCCSDSVIGFHYVDNRLMYVMEYLVYHVHPFGIHPQLTGSAIKDKIIRYLQKLPPRNVTKTLEGKPDGLITKLL